LATVPAGNISTDETMCKDAIASSTVMPLGAAYRQPSAQSTPRGAVGNRGCGGWRTDSHPNKRQNRRKQASSRPTLDVYR